MTDEQQLTDQAIPTATAIADAARFMAQLSGLLTRDIDPDRFADRFGTSINHPAFVMGHCGYFAGYCIEMLDGPRVLESRDSELYGLGSKCLDEPSRYPDKDAAVNALVDRLHQAAEFIETGGDQPLARSSEGTFFAEKFSTLGGIANFMLVGHVGYHIGQISAWRRVAGMGSAMSF
ncbi:MAG: hypothetical protein CMJ32_09705 [Phycisphaerae bacterium]|nr:hypothetical protein [Phycisphaerae bacterium]